MNAKHATDAVERAARPHAEKFAKAGYAARAVVYAVVGVLAVRVALGEGGRVTDSRGAVQAVGSQPFGVFLLAALAAGLAAFVAWRLYTRDTLCARPLARRP